VFDKGVMEDGQGVAVDFRNTVILLTSNVGQDVLGAACRAEPAPGNDALVELLRPALLACFQPAFLARLVIVPYRPLGPAQLAAIARLKLELVKRRFEQHHQAGFSYDPALPAQVAAGCTDADSGAREIDHALAQSLLPELSARILERVALGRPFASVHVGAAGDGGYVFSFAQGVA
jgi:type VI secretion system protein VasG